MASPTASPVTAAAPVPAPAAEAPQHFLQRIKLFSALSTLE